MGRTKTDQRLDTPSIRLNLQPREGNEPYWRTITTGTANGYRRGKKSGSWIARFYTPEAGRRFQKLGIADDLQDADGIKTLSWKQALDAADKWFDQLVEEDSGEVIAGSYTVADAMDYYLKEKARKWKCKPEKVREHPKAARIAAVIDAHILPSLGNIELSKLRDKKLSDWRDSVVDAAPRVRSKVGKPQAFRAFAVSYTHLR